MVLVALGSLLGRSWPFLAFLGAVLSDLVPPLGRFLVLLGRSWGDLGSFSVALRVQFFSSVFVVVVVVVVVVAAAK